MIMVRRIAALFIGLILCISSAFAESFIVKKIEVEGLQKISLGTVLSYLPVKEGDRIDTSQTPEIIRALYKTGFFGDVDVSMSNSVLYVKVTERPVISTINISGNDKITKKQLLTVLKEIGLTEGQVLDSSILSGMQQALVQQYYNLGYYNVRVDMDVVSDKQNKVIVNIKVHEGPVATIKKIEVIGNESFDEKTLLNLFSLSTHKWWKFWSDADQYSKEKLDGDLEKLHSFYLDKGYLKFKVDSTQVSITPDKKHIYIIIHVEEGFIYHVSGVSVTGKLLGKGDEIKKMVYIVPGDTFSRQATLRVTANLTRLYGDLGYAMPDIKTEPVINEKNKTVFIKFVVDPGKKIYVRRINFAGNTKTNEYVLRREMRQQEGAVYSMSKVNESKRRLANLGYLENIDVKMEPVPGQPDQVDLIYNVKETSSAEAKLQMGYSTADGLIYGASLDEQNFLGTGRNVAVQFDNSSSVQNYSISYYNPYFTMNNVSLKIAAFAQRTDPSDEDESTYTMDVYGASAIYGIPLSDFNRANFGYGYEYTDLNESSGSPKEVTDFIDKFGSTFNQVKLIAGWRYDKLDRAIYPTEGFAQSVNTEIYVPVSSNDLEFYKATYRNVYYKPIGKRFIFNVRSEFGYGNGFGDTGPLPFFKNFFLGGMHSVRGFQNNSLGPKDSNGDPIGGAASENASIGIILPPFIMDSLRMTVFVDGGNLYEHGFSLDKIRSSTGIQFDWRSPIGPLAFSLATPIKSYDGDDEQIFDFSIGMSF